MLVALDASGVRRLIHGHTHRPAVHRINRDHILMKRVVLGDWYEQGSVLRVHAEDISLTALSRSDAVAQS